MTRIRHFCELRRFDSFSDRYNYLQLKGTVGQSTFAFERYINQSFYRSRQWKLVRDEVIARDNGCDLGVDGFEIFDRIIIHHMNPMTSEDIESGEETILNPDFLITTTHRTHNAIHYGDEKLLVQPLDERRPGDTRLWN